MTTVNDCQMTELPKIGGDRRGYITPIYCNKHVPFRIRRIYYLYDVPGGESRAGHAHKELQQLIVSVMGSFDLILDDGKNKKKFTLNRAYYGVHVCPYIWRELENFSSGAVCVVLASRPYDEGDYIRDYNEFLDEKTR